MAFMQQQVELMRFHYTIDGPCGNVFFFASTGMESTLDAMAEWLEFDAPDFFADMFGEPEGYYWSVEFEPAPKWFARLSAPGYMDCTDWSGPYDTEAEAKVYLDAEYPEDE